MKVYGAAPNLECVFVQNNTQVLTCSETFCKSCTTISHYMKTEAVGRLFCGTNDTFMECLTEKMEVIGKSYVVGSSIRTILRA